MSYAQRPMGDYKTYGYAGDPGWLSAAFGFLKKKVLPMIIGTARKQVGGVIAGTAIGTAVGTAVGPPAPGMQPPPGSIGGALTMPGGTRISVAGVLPSHAALPGHTPAGYHLDKKTGTRWVKNRRMNVANPRALRKALRRTDGFVKLAKRSLKGTGYAVRRA